MDVSNDPYRVSISEMVRRIGKSNARRLLVIEGLGPSTADKLVRDSYPSRVGALMGAAIQRAVQASKIQAS